MKFSDIETISHGVSDYLADNKIVDMTEIQRQTYKHIMDNRDIIACSSTGTGKTLAYLIPIINRLKGDFYNFINKPVVLLRLFAAYFVSAGIKSGKYTDLIRVGLGRYA